MLYCTTCRQVANAGEAMCARCQNGYISRLACGSCGKTVPAGHSFCITCEGAPKEISVESSQLAPRQMPMPNLPPLDLILPPGLSSPEMAVVPDTYNAGRFGVKATVTMNGNDAEIMTKMNQVAMMLHALAKEMNGFQGVSDNTRRVIKMCRGLATELQEEVEVRRGPQ